MIAPYGSHGGNIIKSKGQMLKDATFRLGELERERDEARKQNETLKLILAQRQTAINALGTKFDLSVEAMQEIINDFLRQEEIKYRQLTEDAKRRYMEGVRNGTAPDFQIIANPDKDKPVPEVAPEAPAEEPAPNVEPFPKPEGQ